MDAFFQVQTYFVKNGLINGQEGEYALTCGFGHRQKDGWYYILPEADDGIGPFDTDEQAQIAGEESLNDE